MKNRRLFYYLFLIFTVAAGSTKLYAQLSAAQMLVLAESGKVDTVKKMLPELLKKNPVNPDYVFVDAVLTTDGNAALAKFAGVVKNYPASKYADAAQFRIYQYYYALGAYKKADSVQTLLKKNYPQSPYVAYVGGAVPVTEKPAVQQVASKTEPPKPVWVIQAGAFIQRKNADALKAQLGKAGFTFVIKEKQAAGATLYVVSTATKNEENAREIASKLESGFKIKARVSRDEAEKP